MRWLYFSGCSDDVVSWQFGGRHVALDASELKLKITLPKQKAITAKLAYRDGCWDVALALPNGSTVQQITPREGSEE